MPLLIKMGAEIEGVGLSDRRIIGKRKLHGAVIKLFQIK